MATDIAEFFSKQNLKSGVNLMGHSMCVDFGVDELQLMTGAVKLLWLWLLTKS
jgi:hypothetical protein